MKTKTAPRRAQKSLFDFYVDLTGGDKKQAQRVMVEEAKTAEYLVRPREGEDTRMVELEVKLTRLGEDGSHRANILQIDPDDALKVCKYINKLCNKRNRVDIEYHGGCSLLASLAEKCCD